MNHILWSIFIVTVIVKAAVVADRNPVITLSDGTMQGRFAETGEANYYAFEGIPFASPPVGNLRFMNPVPVEPWSGTLNATKPQSICLSSIWPVTGNSEDENCLFINVFTPTLNDSANLAVMVYIYGGRFSMLCSQQNVVCSMGGPEYFMTKQVILVQFNYRVGPFGFLSTSDGVIPGNAGLKDQVMALRWVQMNIHHFGGNPEKVTIFGNSAGAASVGLHVLSSQSKGLFRAAICESGSGLMRVTVKQRPKEQAQMVIRALTNDSKNLTDSNAIKKFLQEVNAKKLMKASITIEDNNFFPVLEVDSTDLFLSEPHYELAVAGSGSRVPLIMGAVTEEALLFFSSIEEVKSTAKLYDEDPERLIPQNFKPKAGLSLRFLGEKVKEMYVGTDTFLNNIHKVLEYISDNEFIRSIIQQAKLHSKFAPVYVYEFSHYRPDPPTIIIPGAGIVTHASELHYLFKETSSVNDTEVDKLTSKRLTQMWTDFAKYLNPTPEKPELFNNIVWPALSKSDSKLVVLSINDTLSLKTDWKAEIFAKWQKYFDDYGMRPFLTY